VPEGLRRAYRGSNAAGLAGVPASGVKIGAASGGGRPVLVSGARGMSGQTFLILFFSLMLLAYLIPPGRR